MKIEDCGLCLLYTSQNMIENGYEDARTLQRRIENMQAWLAKPELLQPDADAEYALSLIHI